MTISVMLYGTVLGLLLVGAAHFMDRALRPFARPTRWLWVAAMAGTALVPLGSFLFPAMPRIAPGSGAVIPLEALYRMWDQAALEGAPALPLLSSLDGPLLMTWIAASLLILLLFAGAALGLKRRSMNWARQRAGGEDVLVSDGVGPALLGLVSPRIVLPPWALALEPDELEMVLLHEAEHREARDPALMAGGILLLALAPWNPALWWGFRRLRLAVEGDCDSRVLAHGVPRQRYGSLLLGVASGARGIFPLAPALAEGGGSFLERRLRMMKNSVGKKRFGGAIAAVLAGGGFLVLACETPTPPAMESAGESTVEASQVDGAVAIELTEGEDVLLEIREAGPGGQEALELSPSSGTLKLRLVGESEAPRGEPLIYVDGVRVGGVGNPREVIAELNPDDIERIEVIKGAAAAALFGEEAAAGVIQIFLKK